MRELSKYEQNLIAGGETFTEFHSFIIEDTVNKHYNNLVDSGLSPLMVNSLYYLNYGIYTALAIPIYGTYVVCSTVIDGYNAVGAALFAPLAKK